VGFEQATVELTTLFEHVRYNKEVLATYSPLD